MDGGEGEGFDGGEEECGVLGGGGEESEVADILINDTRMGRILISLPIFIFVFEFRRGRRRDEVCSEPLEGSFPLDEELGMGVGEVVEEVGD